MALLCCLLLLFAGRLAAASKPFGYGEEGGGLMPGEEVLPLLPPSMRPDAGAATGAADATAPKDESYGTLTPTIPTTPEEPAPSTGEASSASAATGQGGYDSQEAASSSSEPANGLNGRAIHDIVNEHNLFRAREHVPPLTWNATLARFSQQYAEQLKGECQMVHSTSPYGENLLQSSGGITWKHTVDEWTAEKRSYNYGANACEPGKMCGHYTAVVWKNTTSVGCGRVLCNNGDTMIVCNYWPPGNYDGERPY